MDTQRLHFPFSRTISRAALILPSLFIFFLVLSLQGCGMVEKKPPEFTQITIPEDGLVQQANNLLREGQKRQAAEIYFQAASRYKAPQRERLILQAAEIAIALQDVALTQNYLSNLNEKTLTHDNVERHLYIQAQLALLSGKPKKALELLPHDTSRLSFALQKKIITTRLRAADAVGDKLLASRQLLLLEPYLRNDKELANNRVQFWKRLMTIKDDQLFNWIQENNEPVLKGWLELAYVVKSSGNNRKFLLDNVENWRVMHPGHPADGAFVVALQEGRIAPLPAEAAIVLPENPESDFTSDFPSEIRRIALLLPFEGSLGKVADSIKKGLEDEHSSADHPETYIKAYDITQAGMAAAYTKAVDDGAELVVGPLTKDTLTDFLKKQTDLPLPILSVNYLDASAEDYYSLFQFGLLPEDEARQVAEFALQRGHQNAVVMLPNSAWGQRLSSAFSKTFQTGGGRVVHYEKYSPSAGEYSRNVRNVLASGGGNFDMIFLAAAPTAAKVIRPTFHHQRMSNVPIYATTHIYSGKLDRKENADLEGIIFTELPWVLDLMQGVRLSQNDPVANESLSKLSSQGYPRMYALGRDLYRIAKDIPAFKNGSISDVKGYTGTINMDGRQQMHRRLPMAIFRNGEPYPYEATPGFRSPSATPFMDENQELSNPATTPVNF